MAKEIITATVTFNPIAKTIDFSSWSSFNINRLIAITNNTRNVLIYSIANSGTGLANIVGNVITLQFDTTSHNASDQLSIMYDPESQATETTLSTINTKLPSALGQKTMANSLPVVISSDQSSILVKMSDGSDIVDIKGSGVAPAAADKTLVVGLHPNSTLPAGSNIIGKVGIDQTTNGTTNKVYADLSLINGVAASATNFLPSRLTNGTTYIDPTQIRALTSADVVSAAQSGTWNINNISGTISLPTGAATSALQTTGNNNLANIDADLGAQADSAATSDTGTFSLISLFKRSLQNWTTLLSKTWSVVGSRPFSVLMAITRPANTTAYAAGKVWSTATTGLTSFPSCALGIGNNQLFKITGVSIVLNRAAPATPAQFGVFVFNNPSPGGNYNDASVFAPLGTTAGAGSAYNALIDLMPTTRLSTLGTACYGYRLNGINYTAQTDASGNVYIALVVNNAYTPNSGEVARIIINGEY